MINSRKCRAVVALAACVMGAGAGSAFAQTQDLTQLTLEDLMSLQVTSVSRKEQALSRTAAAVHVITAGDIRRSGARTIPDLLRMVPGFNVAQIDASTWAVSARGFNGRFANKLLVLIDGRNVYSELFGGVHWDMQTMPLSDIERIEVVRGTGGSLWGTNAVNGIVNIITKTAYQTQGGFAKATLAGSRSAGAEMRYGGRMGPAAYYRLYGKYSTQGMSLPVEAFADPDDASQRLGGVRIDWLGDVNRVFVHGSVQGGKGRHLLEERLLSPPWATVVNERSDFTDGTALVSWTRSVSSRAETNVQASYQRYARHRDDAKTDPFGDQWDIFDIEARQRRRVGRHELVAGIGYRFSSARIANTPHLALTPDNERSSLVTGFLQNEMEMPQNVWVTPGVKLEHNPFTGLEVQPSVRVTWSPTSRHAFWAAASRSVRTPSMVERGVRTVAGTSPGPGGLPVVLMLEGNPAVGAESLRALEAGYRAQLGRVFIDVTAFNNEYRHLVGATAGAPVRGVVADRAVALIPLQVGNGRRARAYGAEATATWRPVGWWSLNAWSALLSVKSGDVENGTNAASGAAVPGRQFGLRSELDLPGRVDMTTFVSRASAVPGSSAAASAFIVQGSSAAYTNVDVRVGWAVRPPIELALGVQKVMHNRTREFVDVTGVQSIPTRTAVFGEAAWRF